MHALCNEIGPIGVGLPTLGLTPDIVAGVIRHYIRDAMKMSYDEEEYQKCPDLLHGSATFLHPVFKAASPVLFVLVGINRTVAMPC